MNKLEFTIFESPVTKKNSQQILVNHKTGRPFIMPSKRYKEYEKNAEQYLPKLEEPISDSCNLKAVFYMPTRRRVDLVNLEEALCDVLVKYGVIEDDNCKIITGMDKSRVEYDKENPRTEVEIMPLKEKINDNFTSLSKL